jgi:hypothetical protein
MSRMAHAASLFSDASFNVGHFDCTGSPRGSQVRGPPRFALLARKMQCLV